MKKYIFAVMALVITSSTYAQVCNVTSVLAVGDRVSIKVNKDANPQYNSIVSSDGTQILIRVLDCNLDKDFVSPSVEGKSDYLKAVTVNKLLTPPITAIVEVVMLLKKEASFGATTTDKSIDIKLKAPEIARTGEELVKKDRFAGQEYYDIMENLPNFPVSFSYRRASVRDVLNTLAARIGINVVFSDDVTGTVTVDLSKVPFDEAFKTVLAMEGLAAQQIGSKILRVATARTIENEKEKAPLLTRFFPLKYQNSNELKKVLEDVIKAEGRKGKVSVDIHSNALIVTDIPSGLESVARLLGQMDIKPLQVLIEAKLVEVNINDGFDLGIEWSTYGGHYSRIGGEDGFNFFGGGNLGANQQASTIGLLTKGLLAPFDSSTSIFTPLPNSPGSGGTGVNFPSIANQISVGSLRFGRITDNYFLDVTLSAAEQKGKAKILSEPKVATLNNRTAKINITTQIPYVTSSTTSESVTPITTSTIVYLDTGITLEVTPQVNADGRITMKIKPTISQVSTTAAPRSDTVEESGAPGLDTRSAETIVMTKDGETIAIGGLIYDLNNDLIYKVPLLGDIPIVGWLFKKKHNNKQRIELLIFVTPKLVEG